MRVSANYCCDQTSGVQPVYHAVAAQNCYPLKNITTNENSIFQSRPSRLEATPFQPAGSQRNVNVDGFVFELNDDCELFDLKFGEPDVSFSPPVLVVNEFSHASHSFYHFRDDHLCTWYCLYLV